MIGADIIVGRISRTALRNANILILETNFVIKSCTNTIYNHEEPGAKKNRRKVLL